MYLHMKLEEEVIIYHIASPQSRSSLVDTLTECRKSTITLLVPRESKIKAIS